MPQGTRLRRRAAPRPLLRPALRRPAAILVAGSAAVTASLALAFAGQSHANRLDSAIDGTVRGGIAGHAEPLHLLAGLGGEELVTAMTAALVAACLVARRWRRAALAGLAVPAASVLTESVLKPLVGRTIGSYPAYPSFPSGMSPRCSRWPPPARYCWPARRARACRAPYGCCWGSAPCSSRPLSAPPWSAWATTTSLTSSLERWSA